MNNPAPSQNLRERADQPGLAAYPAHADAVPLYGPEMQNNPAELYRTMRRQHGSVVPVLLVGDVPAWLVIGYRELHYVTTNPELFSRDNRRWNYWDRIPPDWPLLPILAGLPIVDGAEHARRMRAIHDVFAEEDPFTMRKHTERICDGLIDRFAGRGRADLIAEYATLIPLAVMAADAGLSDEEAGMLLQDLTAMLDAGPEALAAGARLQAMLEGAVAEARAQQSRNLIGRMAAHPVGLTAEEVVGNLLAVVAASHQATADWIGNTLRLMLTDSRFAVDLFGGRRSISMAMNEVLWEDPPNPVLAGRWPVRDTQLGGQRIRAGDLLLLGLAAANADPQVRPDAAAGVSGNQAHLAFGHGTHRCPYPAQELAEIVAGTAVEILLDRLPDIELAVSPEALVWRPSLVVRGLVSLPVVFTPH